MFSKISVSEELLADFDRYEEPYFYFTFFFEIEKRLPRVRIQLFSYEKENGTVYFYGIRESDLVKHQIMVTGKGCFKESDFLHGFEKFTEATKIFSNGKRLNAVGRDQFIEPVAKFIKERSLPYEFGLNPCFEFVIPKEKEKLLLEANKMELPEGYQLGKSDPKDAGFITSKWKFAEASEGEVENTVQKIASFPSISLRNEKNKLIGFEMLDVSGCLSHLYVLEEYRQKGLGKAIEEEHSRQIIRAGITVFKYVEQGNRIVVDSALRSPYWIANKKEKDGSYNFMTWMYLSPIK